MEYIRRFQKASLKKVYLVVTRKCNLSCPFCIRSSVPTEESTLSKELIYSYLAQIKEMNDQITLIITGGEATLHPDFREILQKSCDMFQKVILCSNGTNLHAFITNSDILKRMTVQISVDGDSLHHNQLRGNDTYEKAKATMTFLISQHIKTVSSSTISAYTIDSVPDMIRDLYESGIRYFKLSAEMPGGEARNRLHEQISVERWNLFCDEIASYSQHFEDIHLNIKKSFPFLGHSIKLDSIPEDLFQKAGCKAGITQVYIYPNQKVYGCPMLIDFPLLDLRLHNLSELETLYQKCALYHYYVNPDSQCTACKYQAICRGGCPGRSISNTDIWNGDALCPVVRGEFI
mgnify:CR=1 FL=1